MELDVAVGLIDKGVKQTGISQAWMDLGAGSGLFTQALSLILAAGSTIEAVDKDARALEKIRVKAGINLITVRDDFTRRVSGKNHWEGILMANSLHFEAEKSRLLGKLKVGLRPSGRLIVVEYEMRSASPWVPYPVGYDDLKRIALDIGFAFVEKIGETP